MKIKVFNSDVRLPDKYLEILEKYSLNKIIFKDNKDWPWHYVIIDITSFEILPELYEKLNCINNEVEGLIFSNADEKEYQYILEIYDGYRE